MDANQLTDEQISNLTGEQIEMLENDPDKLIEILNGQKKSDDEQSQTAEQDGATTGAGDEDEKEPEEEEPIVLNKSGKGAIPYSAHKSLRVENATLKEQLETAQSQLQEMDKLKALLQEKKEAKGDEKATEAVDVTIANHLKVLEADYPELHQVMTAVLDGSKKESAKFQQQAEKLEKKLAELDREKEEAKRAAEKSVSEQVNEAKDNNPDLAYWEVNDREAFEEAVRQDQAMLTTAKWAKAPYAERFVEVVRRVRAVMPEASAPKTTKSAEEIKATAKAKLEKAPARKTTTLSDIPSGANPTSEGDSVENLSPFELTHKLMSMPAHKPSAMRSGIY